jgi:acyl phosphate:glycerol-3-phosphate acyltransferase
MTAVAVTVLAYALGCVSTGYYVVRLVTGEDLRRLATGSTGARNVGRRLGVRAAAVTLAVDVAKGAAAVAVAAVAAGGGAAGAALVAVVGGHVAPAQLGFRGGRGLGPALGGMVVLDWRVAAAGLGVAAISTAATRAPTASGLAGVVAAPVAALVAGERTMALAAGLTAAIVLAAHARPASVSRRRS